MRLQSSNIVEDSKTFACTLFLVWHERQAYVHFPEPVGGDEPWLNSACRKFDLVREVT